MSRSNNTEIKNPAKYFLEWMGETGGFKYYNKETKEQIPIPLPFKFIVLDTLSTIKGWSDADQSGYWSNEVRDLKKESFTVRTKKGIVEEGLYADIHPRMAGAKYCQSVYILMKEGDAYIMANIQIHGAALGSWIDYRKKNKIYEGGIQVKTFIDAKKGKTEYKIPTWEAIPVSEESDALAKDEDKKLQEYLKAYFERNSIPKEDLPPAEKIYVDKEREEWHEMEATRKTRQLADEKNIADEILQPNPFTPNDDQDDLPF